MGAATGNQALEAVAGNQALEAGARKKEGVRGKRETVGQSQGEPENTGVRISSFIRSSGRWADGREGVAGFEGSGGTWVVGGRG